jgi:hypothetical protein
MVTGEGTLTGRPMTATRLRQAARRMFADLDAELADRMEPDQLVEESRRAHHNTWMVLDDNGDGTWSGRFTLPELQGRWLRQALERLSSPRRLYCDAQGKTHDETIDNGLQNLSWTEHLGQAFCELIEHLPTAGYTNGNAATLVAHIDLDDLLRGVGAATLDGGVRISAAEVRRLACEASILPLVMSGESVPLDLGRSQRLHSHHQRIALSATHDSCAVGGCQRPFAWCEIHRHRLRWAKGGRTDIDNGLPLCGYHHRRAHDDRWDLRCHSSGEYRFHRRRLADDFPARSRVRKVVGVRSSSVASDACATRPRSGIQPAGHQWVRCRRAHLALGSRTWSSTRPVPRQIWARWCVALRPGADRAAFVVRLG